MVRPHVLMPPLTRFVDGNGPVFAGKIFPFCFITIACGAISGFHSLISSGTTPKMIQREGHARFIGYGAMLLESFVGVMAMVAACAMPPGVYFAINSPAQIVGAAPDAAAQTISSWGYPLSAQTMANLAHSVGEQTLWNRAGGAPSLAVGMAQIFSTTIGGERLLSIWYHFAIMFEALFILTVLDAGTRVGRFMIQELGGRIWKPFGRLNWYPAILLSSAVIVAAWGYFLYQGVIDPLGGINSLWPLFGISNQLLAAVALVVATSILLKMGRLKWIWVTLLPMAWLVVITMTASYDKIFSANPRIGFLSFANGLAAQIAAGKIPAAKIGETQRIIFNQRLDAAVTAVLALMILVLLVEADRAMARNSQTRQGIRIARNSVCGHTVGGGRLMRASVLKLSGSPPLIFGKVCASGAAMLLTRPTAGAPARVGETHPLSPAQFYVEQLNKKYSRPNRCC